jgi:hypothetical protein
MFYTGHIRTLIGADAITGDLQFVLCGTEAMETEPEI